MLRLESLEPRSLLTTLVALVDTGIDLKPNDPSYLNDSKYYDLADAYNSYDGSSNVQDNNGHGSSVADNIVAGIQATTSQSGAGGANVLILPIRDTDNNGNLSTDAIINGICYAANKGAAVINLSFASLTNFSSSSQDAQHPDMSLSSAIQYAQSKGAVVVAAAGNMGYLINNTQYGNQDIDIETPDPVYPAVLGHDVPLSNMLVTASFNTSTSALQLDSNYGPGHVDLAAPGSETSFAAGYLSGVVGVVAALRPDFSYTQIIARITSTVQQFASLAGKIVTGGVVSPANAVNGLLAPTVVSTASASPATVSGTTTTLSVLGGDAGGESTLSYHWQTISAPPGAPSPTFSANNSNAAKNTTTTFSDAGTYTFQATITDRDGGTVTSTSSVTVNPVLTSIGVNQQGTTLTAGNTQTFTATAYDQFHVALAAPPSIAWSVSGSAGGKISSSGVYTASVSGSGTDVITASSGAISGTATVSVTASPSQGTPSATSLGQDGVDLVGSGALTGSPDGLQDVDILLSGLNASKTIRYIDVLGVGGGEWQYNAANGPSPHRSDAAALVQTAGASSAHLYVQPYKTETGRSYQVEILDTDGTSLSLFSSPVYANPQLAMTSAPTPATPTATSLGQDGVDLVGSGPLGNSPDGLQDIDILLSGLDPSKSISYIDVLGVGGGEWQYNAANGPSPHRSDFAALVRAAGSSTAHLYVQPYMDETGRNYQINIVYSDGTVLHLFTGPVYAKRNLAVS
jgi:hypothetical protein